MPSEVTLIAAATIALLFALANAIICVRARAEADDLASREYPESDCFPPRKARADFIEGE